MTCSPKRRLRTADKPGQKSGQNHLKSNFQNGVWNFSQWGTNIDWEFFVPPKFFGQISAQISGNNSVRSGPSKPNQRKVSSWTFRSGIPEQKFNVNRACFPKEKHQNSQKWAKFMNFLFWPFLWFGLPGRLLTYCYRQKGIFEMRLGHPISRAQVFAPLTSKWLKQQKLKFSQKASCRNFSARKTGARNGCANFMGAWHFVVHSAGQPPCLI